MPDRWSVYAKSAGCFLLVCLSTLGLDRLLRGPIHERDLRLAAAFSAVQLSAIASITLYLGGRRAYARFQNTLHSQIQPAIQDRVMALALAGENWSTPMPSHGPSRAVLEQCIGHALAGLKASGRDRLASFASERGFAGQWQRECVTGPLLRRKRAISLLGLISGVSPAGIDLLWRSLADKHPEIRAEAARALLLTGNLLMVEQVFRCVLTDSLLVRVLLTNDLKRHARHLLAEAVPSILSAGGPAEKRSCLEMLTAWKLAIPGFDIAMLLEEGVSPVAWPLIAALLPYVSVGESVEGYLATALGSQDLEVQCAAARAAGQLKLDGLIPALNAALAGNVRLALAAASALAQLGTPGTRNLEMALRGLDRKAAAAAMEALETLTVGIA